MYMASIGERLLQVWLDRTGEQLSARDFFLTYMHPLFYEPERMLQWVINSPFTQRMKVGEGQTLPQVQLARFLELADGVATGSADGSFVLGYPAAGTTGTTSGQVSDNTPRPTPEQVYCSWIGAALGIGAGGLSMLLQEPPVLWALVEGWQHYRKLLDDQPTLKSNQIDTWNGRWLVHALSPAYDPADPLRGFDFESMVETKMGVTGITSQPWVQLLFTLSQALPAPQLVAYIYGLGKTNRTVGFIPLFLGEIRTLPDLYHRLFELKGAGQQWAALSQAYETHLGLSAACETGAVGLDALEPARLRQFITTRPGPAKTPAQAQQQEIYQLWLSAMLQQDSTKATAAEAADRLAGALAAFSTYESPQQKGRGKTSNGQLVDQALSPASFTRFVDTLTAIMNELPRDADYRAVLEETVVVTTEMARPQFSIFLSLLRFKYSARLG